MYLGLHRRRPGGGRGAAIASKFLSNPRASHLGQDLSAHHVVAGCIDSARPLGGTPAKQCLRGTINT